MLTIEKNNHSTTSKPRPTPASNLSSNAYDRMRWQAKQLAQSRLIALPEAQRILLIFAEPQELITATYACLEKGHTGIAYRFKAGQQQALLKDIQKHQIQKIWCPPAFKQEFQKILSGTAYAHLLL